MDELERRYREGAKAAKRYFIVSFSLCVAGAGFAVLGLLVHVRWTAVGLACCAVSLAMSIRQTRRLRAQKRAREAKIAAWQEGHRA